MFGTWRGKWEGLLTVLQARFGPVPQHIPSRLETSSVEDLEVIQRFRDRAGVLPRRDIPI